MQKIIIDMYLYRELSPTSRYIVLDCEESLTLHQLQKMIALRLEYPVMPSQIRLKYGRAIIANTGMLAAASASAASALKIFTMDF
jgi:hypothetical protein